MLAGGRMRFSDRQVDLFCLRQPLESGRGSRQVIRSLPRVLVWPTSRRQHVTECDAHGLPGHACERALGAEQEALHGQSFRKARSPHRPKGLEELHLQAGRRVERRRGVVCETVRSREEGVSLKHLHMPL